MITVLATGGFNTIQDRGRFGSRRFGVSTSGAMDPVALAVGNALLGNAADAAAIEVQSFPFLIRFETATTFALTGADCDMSLSGRPLPPWWCAAARTGDVLRIDHPRAGARSYVTVAGGIASPCVLHSRSTHLRAGFGGLDGRSLREGDAIPVALESGEPVEGGGYGVLPPRVALGDAGEPDGALAIRVLRAGEYDLFPRAGQEAFWATRWRIGVQSDRTGYRLGGERLTLPAPVELRSYGVMPGLIQVPPAGEPIVQMSDANTVGGYPKMAAVIEADLWRLGQARPGSRLRFVEVTHAEAVGAQARIAAYVAEVRRAARTIRPAGPPLSSPVPQERTA